MRGPLFEESRGEPYYLGLTPRSDAACNFRSEPSTWKHTRRELLHPSRLEALGERNETSNVEYRISNIEDLLSTVAPETISNSKSRPAKVTPAPATDIESKSWPGQELFRQLLLNHHLLASSTSRLLLFYYILYYTPHLLSLHPHPHPQALGSKRLAISSQDVGSSPCRRTTVAISTAREPDSPPHLTTLHSPNHKPQQASANPKLPSFQPSFFVLRSS